MFKEDYRKNRQQEETNEHQNDALDRKVQIAITLLCCFIATHNLPFLLIDHLINLLQIIFPDSEIAKKIHLKRNKCTQIIKKI